MFEYYLFLIFLCILISYIETNKFMLTFDVIPLALTGILRYYFYVVNKEENECISFIDFTIISFRLFLTV